MVFSPRATAASTNPRVDTSSVAERTMRAAPGNNTTTAARTSTGLDASQVR